MRKLLRFLGLALGTLLLLAVFFLAGIFWQLQASLPQLDGARPLAGLSAPVQIRRDALGVPDIVATNRLDASRALGFIHAQERFFQMDVLRRSGAGELAALFGPALVDHDQGIRRHQLRSVAKASLQQLPSQHRALLDAYVEGVNAGLNALDARPPEYLLLRARPQPWLPEDTLLAGYAMYFALQDAEGRGELERAVIESRLPAAVRAFYLPEGSLWDAALDGTSRPLGPMPGPEVVDFSRETNSPTTASVSYEPSRSSSFARHAGEGRGEGPPTHSRFLAAMRAQNGEVPPSHEPSLMPGSNSWGVDGASSATGAAIVANDMHLDLALPNIWFRVAFRWTDASGRSRRMVGATLPGAPALIVGSNGDIAWGFTNATLDSTDLIELELDPADPGRYRTPDGWKPFESINETIQIAGAAPRTFTFEKTIWGPVLPASDLQHGKRHAIHWIAHQPGSVNMGLFELENLRSVQEALDFAPDCHIAMQNFLVGDSHGALGWTLIGPVPHRVGFDGRTPSSWADGSRRWDGWLPNSKRPRALANPGQRLWTANNRIVGSPEYLALGAEITDAGARAHQIRDDLLTLPNRTDEVGLLSIHRDDRALLLVRWQKLLLDTLASPTHAALTTNATRWAEARPAVENWGARAATNSVGYRLVRAFRHRALERLYQPLIDRSGVAPMAILGYRERMEHAFWTVMEKHPSHLLPARYKSYEALLASAFDDVLADLDAQQTSIRDATWGARNTVHIGHPISRAVPPLGRILDLSPIQLPGDDHMPRVQGRAFGASERMVVSPGHEDAGIFHMPGGQSGHFLSPFYRAGHDAWVNITPTPLLPGPAHHQLTLVPMAQN